MAKGREPQNQKPHLQKDARKAELGSVEEAPRGFVELATRSPDGRNTPLGNNNPTPA